MDVFTLCASESPNFFCHTAEKITKSIKRRGEAVPLGIDNVVEVLKEIGQGYMIELSHMLERLGLSQYLQAFLDEGFDSWETLMDVTESDLEALQVKLGHRRKLQRAIIETRGETREDITLGTLTQPGPKDGDTYRSEEEATISTREQKRPIGFVNSNPAVQKRKYRRHPKPDEYAPERPPSAYVLFSNQMRDKLKGQELSFTEIAKIVGERWQESTTREKEPCERQAQAMKEKYYANLAEYKKTPHFAQYQEYLAEFKAKHNPQDSKKPKTESEMPGSVRSHSQERVERQVDTPALSSRYRQSPSSPTNSYDQSTMGWQNAVSPKSHMRQPIRSPHGSDASQLQTASPTVYSFRPLPRTGSDDTTRNQDSKRQMLPLHILQGKPYQSNILSHPSLPHDPSSPKPSFTHSSSYDISQSPPRQATIISETVPRLTHEETVGSAVSDRSQAPEPWATNPAYTLPAIEVNTRNTERVLPVPQPTLSSILIAGPLASTSPTSRKSSQNRSQLPNGHDSGAKSSIAALLRAGEELDRDFALEPVRKSGHRDCEGPLE